MPIALGFHLVLKIIFGLIKLIILVLPKQIFASSKALSSYTRPSLDFGNLNVLFLVQNFILNYEFIDNKWVI